jgi:hypothetical protein
VAAAHDQRLRRRLVGVALVAAALVAAAFLEHGSPASARGVANGTLYVAPGGSDGGGCTQASPCRSFDAAYHRAAAGESVVVAAGSYGSQRLTADASKLSAKADVQFRPAQGAQVTLDELRVEGSHVSFAGMKASDFYAGINRPVPQTSQPAYVSFRNMTLNVFFISGASYVRILGGSVGPTVDNAAQIDDCDGCNYHPSHITIDGVRFHDFVRQTPGIHMECLHVYSANDLVLRNNSFVNCAIFDVLVNNYGELGSASGFTVENNFFDRPGSGEPSGSLSDGNSSLEFTPFGAGAPEVLSNITVRNNTFLATLLFDPASGSFQNATVSGNVGQMATFSCPNGSGVAFSHNVWYSDYSAPGRCGSTDRSVSGGHQAIHFVHYPDNLHLDHGSPALAAAGMGEAPAVDADGQARPQRAPADAGADQREPALLVPGRALGAARFGATRESVVGFYGQPASSGRRRLAKGAPLVQLDRYRLHGGSVWIAYADDKVVGLGTTSPYYTTATGGGVGAKLPPEAAAAKAACAGARKTAAGGAIVVYRGGAAVTSVAMALPRYAAGDRCGPRA